MKTASIALVNAAEMARQHPNSFELPSAEQLYKVTAGSLVKVCDGGERFWVQLYSRRGNILRGRVDSVTIFSEAEFDDVIELHIDNIFDIHELVRPTR